jgi:hypothetical protein
VQYLQSVSKRLKQIGIVAALGCGCVAEDSTTSDGAGTIANQGLTTAVPAARVYVASGATIYDPSVATMSGSTFTATADMGAGTFAVSVSPINANATAQAGIFQVVLTNNTGAPVTIDRGALRAHFDGTYNHPPVPGRSTATSVSAHLSVAASGAGTFTARGDHSVSFRYDPDGNLITSTNMLRKVYEANGARVHVSRAQPKRLKMDLVMPQFILGPRGKLYISLQLHVTAQNATANFSDESATIRLALPPGVTLDNDAAVPLTWVTEGGALGACAVTPVPATLRNDWGLSSFYTKHAELRGFPILSSSQVSDRALCVAHDVLSHLLAARPEIIDRLIDRKIRLAIMAPTEVTTDIPEHASLTPKQYWDTRARGLGATLARPATSVGEENLLCLAGDPYAGESILVHEFSHTIFNMGIELDESGAGALLDTTYAAAIAAGRFANTYAATNRDEYWAEGAQDWFDSNATAIPPNGIHNHIYTRAQLLSYDPELSVLMESVFGNDAWRYACP